MQGFTKRTDQPVHGPMAQLQVSPGPHNVDADKRAWVSETKLPILQRCLDKAYHFEEKKSGCKRIAREQKINEESNTKQEISAKENQVEGF